MFEGVKEREKWWKLGYSILSWEDIQTLKRYLRVISSLGNPFLKRKSRKTNSFLLKMELEYYKFWWGSLKWHCNLEKTSNKESTIMKILRLAPKNNPVFEIWKSIQKWLRYEWFSGEKSNQKFSGKMHASGCNFYIIRNIFPKAINLCRIDLGTFLSALRFRLLC